MTLEELLRHAVRGRRFIVGEFRGARADLTGYVDRKTGDAISQVVAIYLIECACRGQFDRAVVRRKLTGVKVEDVLFPQERGKLYVFFLDSFRWERDGFTGWMPADQEPEPLEPVTEAGCAPSGALPPLNLVYRETTPQTV